MYIWISDSICCAGRAAPVETRRVFDARVASAVAKCIVHAHNGLQNTKHGPLKLEYSEALSCIVTAFSGTVVGVSCVNCISHGLSALRMHCTRAFSCNDVCSLSLIPCRGRTTGRTVTWRLQASECGWTVVCVACKKIIVQVPIATVRVEW